MYPWQSEQWRRVVSMHQAGRFPHALLLRGPRGIGKNDFANYTGAALVCEEPPFDAGPCGQCRGCRVLRADSHPDLFRVSPPVEKQLIGIDQVRALIASMSLTPQFAGQKVIIVSPAESMTVSAANSLLKTLEEPPGPAVFLLVSHRSARLPVTIRSRCQFIDFPLPDVATARTWLSQALAPDHEHDAALRLSLAGGAPLSALASGGNDEDGQRADVLAAVTGLVNGGEHPVAAALRWRRTGASAVLRWLLLLSSDLIRVKLCPDYQRFAQLEQTQTVTRLANNLDTLRLFRIYDNCLFAQRAMEESYNLNEQLLLEGIAIDWVTP